MRNWRTSRWCPVERNETQRIGHVPRGKMCKRDEERATKKKEDEIKTGWHSFLAWPGFSAPLGPLSTMLCQAWNTYILFYIYNIYAYIYRHHIPFFNKPWKTHIPRLKSPKVPWFYFWYNNKHNGLFFSFIIILFFNAH